LTLPGYIPGKSVRLLRFTARAGIVQFGKMVSPLQFVYRYGTGLRYFRLCLQAERDLNSTAKRHLGTAKRP